MTTPGQEPEHELDDRPSKSQRKRDMQHLKDLALKLTELTGETLERVQPPELLDAVKTAARIHRGSARKRQIQYIAKLLSRMDVAPVQRIVDEVDASSAAHVARFHQLEQWRERLLSDDPDAMTEICEHFPRIDRQQLRQLIRQARAEKTREEHGPQFRKLFQFLKQQDQDSD